MALDPRCPQAALDAVMADPLIARLERSTGLTRRDLATDLSSLIVLALDAVAEHGARPVRDTLLRE